MENASLPCIAMGAVNLYVAAYYMLMFMMRPRERHYLPFSLLGLSVGFYDFFSAGLYNSRSLEEGIHWQSLQFFAVIAISAAHIRFAAIFLGKERDRILRFSLVWFALLLVAAIFAGPDLTLSTARPAVKTVGFPGLFQLMYFEGDPGPVYLIEIASCILTYVYLVILYISAYRKTRNRGLFLISVGQGAYFFGVINDSLVSMGLLPFPYISEYAFFLIILSMAAVLLEQFVIVHRERESLTEGLEERVRERTSEIEKLSEQLKRLADLDPLTGVYNRRFFNEYFAIEVKRATNQLQYGKQIHPPEKNHMNFGLVIFDVDHFKGINDTYGHLTGDLVLRQITDIIRSNLFTRDVVSRFGGDEFVLLLTKTSAAGILHAAEKIRREIADYRFDLEGYGPAQVTVSMGLVDFDEVDRKECEEILRLADHRLLRAKRAGRNRVVFNEV